MNIAAYCRVSTDKADQLNSLEAQKKFFAEYTGRTGDRLVRLYADEGISGTKIKNRREFLNMMSDAEKGLFDLVIVKDISRFARNTVDLLQNVRRLKELGIETQFLTANMTNMGNSEFVLTIFGALAQEESANTSKRVKFGKKINAKKGRVPNIVYGYNKTPGDYFNLTINEKEAETVRQIYRWYLEDGYGAAKIANILNGRGLKTKRCCKWSQNAVCRILTNELYTGKIINGKQEVEDFLTGRRKDKDEAEWLVTERPDLKIVAQEDFTKAQEILHSRYEAFNMNRERQSSAYPFSTLIRCKECGLSFRRTVRTYKNTYVRWVCSGHNGRGSLCCPNAVTIDEGGLMDFLRDCFLSILKDKKKALDYVVNELRRVCTANDDNLKYRKEVEARRDRLAKSRERYMEMYADGIIDRCALNEKIGSLQMELGQTEDELMLLGTGADENRAKRLEGILNDMFKKPEDIVDVAAMNNAQLKKLIERIEVDKEGMVIVHMVCHH